MASITREKIEMFMSITDAPEEVALRRLEEHAGDLNEAVDAHFREGDRNVLQEAPVSVTAPLDDLMDIDDPPELERRGPSSLLSATRGMNPFSVLDSTFQRGLFDSASLFDPIPDLMGGTRAPFVSQPREVREIPIEVRDGHDNITGHGPRIEDVTDTVDAGGPEIRGTVIVDDEDDDGVPLRGNRSDTRPSAPQIDDTADYGNDIEEEMIRAAIEASKRDAELQNNDGLNSVGAQPMASQRQDTDLAHAVSVSLRTAEQEVMRRQLSMTAGVSGSNAGRPIEVEDLTNVGEPSQRSQGVGFSDKSSSQHKKEAGSSSIQDEIDELDEQPLVRNRSRRRSSGSVEAEREIGETEVIPALIPPQPTVGTETQPNGSAFASAEWGGISSEEHDEAVMLEAAMFGGIPESGYHVPYAPHQMMPPVVETAWSEPRPPSPSLVAQRAIREQQDDEYLASLQADRERELKAIEEENAAKEAELVEHRRKEEEAQRKLFAEQELERQLAAKQASLPEEPALGDENAVTLLVRMPDGSRHGRRFRKSDKLQSLFDFIDVGRMVKPGTYRLVRPYPRQAFSDGESSLSLTELGLTSKQEALFMEPI